MFSLIVATVALSFVSVPLPQPESVSKPRVARRGKGAHANRSSFHQILSVSSVNSSPATGHLAKPTAHDRGMEQGAAYKRMKSRRPRERP